MQQHRRGRPAGRLIHAEGFEALLKAKGFGKKACAEACGVSPGYLSDLLAHRCGATPKLVERLAAVLGVAPAAIFPEVCNWVPPLPDRAAKRIKVGI